MTERDGATPPIVCDMTGAPDTPAQRVDEYARLFARAYLARERTDAGVRWRFDAACGIEAWARDLAARENACCAFMRHTVRVVDAEVWWDMTTIDDTTARAVLDLFYELPTRARLGIPVVFSDGR
jgi:hypothetical protein